jgi:hypothetical protein
MKSPTVDIIVPVWNSPFETRACLAAILKYSPEARLIIVDSGGNRETELFWEFSEPLGERGLFINRSVISTWFGPLIWDLPAQDATLLLLLRPLSW